MTDYFIDLKDGRRVPVSKAAEEKVHFAIAVPLLHPRCFLTPTLSVSVHAIAGFFAVDYYR